MSYTRLKYRIRGGANKNLSNHEKKSRLDILLIVLELLKNNNITYSIINGIDDYPENIGRDVDIVIDKRDNLALIKSFREYFTENPKYILLARKSGYGLYQFTIIEENFNSDFISVQLDFTYSNINWIIGVFNPMPIKKILNSTKEQNGIKFSEWGNYIKTIRPLVYYHPDNIKKKHHIYLKIINGKYCDDYKKILGDKLFKKFEKVVNKGQNELIKWAENLKCKLYFSFLVRNPFISIKNMFFVLLRRIKVLYFNKVPIIGVVGPDGIGKTTLIRKSSEILNKAGLDIRVKHWRPGLLPNLGIFIGKKDSNIGINYPPNKKKYRFQLLRFIYYYFDFLLGYFILDSKYLPESEFHLVIYDRCSIDMLVNPLRYGFNSKKFVNLIYKYTPKPDYIIFLHDAEDSIYSRKKELSIDEIKSQNKIWYQLYLDRRINKIIECGNGIDISAKEISKSLLEFLKQYYKI